MTHTGKDVISAHLESIQLLKTIDEADFTPPPDAYPVPRRIAISAGVAQGQLLKNTPPTYPVDALAARVSGTVVVRALIDKDGHVTDPQVVSGPPILRQAAIDAVRHWLYKPYLLNGEKVEVDTTINIVFNLR
jgi:periplasmic protein TonB